MTAIANESSLYIIFILDNVAYGMDINYVQEIMRVPQVTTLPAMADYLVGITNLRGSIIPIIDLRRKLLRSESELSDDSRVIVLEVENKRSGLIVDEVSEVVKISHETFVSSEDMGNCSYSEYILGVAHLENRLLIMLKAETILDM